MRFAAFRALKFVSKAVAFHYPAIQDIAVPAIIFVRRYMADLIEPALGRAVVHIDLKNAFVLIQRHCKISGFFIERMGPIFKASS